MKLIGRALAYAGLAVVLAAASAACSLAADETGSSPVDRQWLAKDIALVKSAKALLKDPRGKIERFMALTAPTFDRPLGFGFRQVHLDLGGGYTRMSLRIAALKEDIVALECIQETTPAQWSLIAQDIREAWQQKPAETSNHGLTAVRFIDQAVIDKAMGDALGPPPPAEPAGSLARSFNLLTSPVAELTVGTGCSSDGSPPPGRKAMDELVAENRWDLIRAVLHGPSPEGRTYAAHALSKARQATGDDEAVMQKLSELDIYVRYCAGCRFYGEKFERILRNLDGQSMFRSRSKERQFRRL